MAPPTSALGEETREGRFVRRQSKFRDRPPTTEAGLLSAVRPLRRALIAPFSEAGVTPAAASARPASVSFSTARASSRRSTVT